MWECVERNKAADRIDELEAENEQLRARVRTSETYPGFKRPETMDQYFDRMSGIQ